MLPGRSASLSRGTPQPHPTSLWGGQQWRRMGAALQRVKLDLRAGSTLIIFLGPEPGELGSAAEKSRAKPHHP